MPNFVYVRLPDLWGVTNSAAADRSLFRWHRASGCPLAICDDVVHALVAVGAVSNFKIHRIQGIFGQGIFETLQALFWFVVVVLFVCVVWFWLCVVVVCVFF